MAFKLNQAKSTDGKGLHTHFKGLDRASNLLTVGIQTDAQDYPDGTSVLAVAVAGEFGNARAHVKPRHFLTLAMSKEKTFYTTKIRAILKKYKKGNTPILNIGMTELGRQGVERTRSHIETNSIGMKGNAPSTIQAKGGDQPMVDSGHLVRQIDYKLEGAKL